MAEACFLTTQCLNGRSSRANDTIELQSKLAAKAAIYCSSDSLMDASELPGVMNRMSESPPNQLGLLDVSTKYRSAPATTSTICRVCYGSIMDTSFRCIQCEDYNMCCLCVTAGKHPQHPVIRTINSTVDRDTATMAAFGTSLKAETASAALIVQLTAKIAEQDAEIERLVSARSEAVALLSRSCDLILIAEKMEKMSRTS